MSNRFDFESIDFWIEPPLLLSVYSDAIRIAKKLNDIELLNLCNEIKSRIENCIQTISNNVDLNSITIYAIDSSYVNPPLELISGVLTVLSYGYVGFSKGKYDRYVTGEVYFNDVHDFEKHIHRLAIVRERELAIKLLKKKGREIDILILDGEIYIHPLPYNLPVENGKLSSISKIINELFKSAKENEVTLVGVVKRVRSRYLSILINKCTQVNDKVITSLVLKPGQYYILGKFEEVLPKWIEINYKQCELIKRCKDKSCPDVEEIMLRRLEEGLENLNRVFTGCYGKYKYVQHIKDIVIAFYKARNAITSTKIEILNFNSKFRVDDIISVLEKLSTNTGYPFILDRVDEYIRLNNRILDYIRILIIRELDTFDKINTFMNLTNLQKSYMYKRLEG